jgi:hypothetical protein
MQEQIRNASGDDFSQLQDFIRYKENQQLSNPEKVSKQYFDILANLDKIKEVLSSIKDYE